VKRWLQTILTSELTGAECAFVCGGERGVQWLVATKPTGKVCDQGLCMRIECCVVQLLCVVLRRALLRQHH